MLKDTVFIGLDTVIVGLDTTFVWQDTLFDEERLFCNVNGEYDIIGSNDRIRIYIDSNFAYYNTCVQEENPSDDYSRTYQDDWIVFTGADGDFRRKIILWEMMED